MILEGVYRRFIPLKGAKGPLDLRLTQQESMAVAQVELPNMEMTRAGRRFALGNIAAITGIAPTATLITTAPQWVIWNGDSFATYFFEELGFIQTASGPSGVGNILLAALFQTPVQLGASYAGTGITSLSNGSRQSKAIVKTAVTITQPAAPVWQIIAVNASAIATFPGQSTLEHRNLQGALAVPPGQGLGLSIIGAAGTTPLFAPFARWVELEVDLE